MRKGEPGELGMGKGEQGNKRERQIMGKGEQGERRNEGKSRNKGKRATWGKGKKGTRGKRANRWKVGTGRHRWCKGLKGIR